MANYDDIFSTQATQEASGTEPFNKEEWAAQKQKEREGVYAIADQTAEAMAADGGVFRSYLDVQARFDRYSVTNAILVAAQKPEATKLADFDTWKKRGAYIQRGAEAISILEPSKEYQREDGSIGVSYNVRKVFDISQTRSRQRPAPTVARDGRLLLKALISHAPCQIQISGELPENVNVRYVPERNAILLRQGMDAPTIFRGLSQELARAHIDKGNYACENPDFAAYSVAYMLCQRNGVSVEGFSFDRMPEGYAQMEPQAIRDEMGVMREVAEKIIGEMNRVFEAQEKPKNRDDGAR